MRRLMMFVLLLAVATPVAATTRLQKLSENRYLITHKKHSGFGGSGKALRMAYEKAGSLCVLLDYKWFEVRDVHSQGRGYNKTASATMEVKFYHEEEIEDLNNCEALASDEQKDKMTKALDRIDPDK